MANQTVKGKAFEYACLKAFKDIIDLNQEVIIVENSAYDNAKLFFDSSSLDQKDILYKAGIAAVRVLLRLEPRLSELVPSNPLLMKLQDDSRGIQGDVRDLICFRNDGWELGFSCKHNHTAVKHSRLSNVLDFGSTWFNVPCSSTYFNDINPIFERLDELKKRNKDWKDITDKDISIYRPLMIAFLNELQRLASEVRNEIPSKLLNYLIGRHDFYKIITLEQRKTTQVQAFNVNGTLNKRSQVDVSDTRIPLLRLPSKFLDITFKNGSNSTIIVTCDNGWSLSFRIHNASTKVESSLKFDIQLIGIPSSLYVNQQLWHD